MWWRLYLQYVQAYKEKKFALWFSQEEFFWNLLNTRYFSDIKKIIVEFSGIMSLLFIIE